MKDRICLVNAGRGILSIDVFYVDVRNMQMRCAWQATTNKQHQEAITSHYQCNSRVWMTLQHSPQTTAPPGAEALLSSQKLSLCLGVKVRFLSGSMLWPHGTQRKAGME